MSRLLPVLFLITACAKHTAQTNPPTPEGTVVLEAELPIDYHPPVVMIDPASTEYRPEFHDLLFDLPCANLSEAERANPCLLGNDGLREGFCHSELSLTVGPGTTVSYVTHEVMLTFDYWSRDTGSASQWPTAQTVGAIRMAFASSCPSQVSAVELAESWYYLGPATGFSIQTEPQPDGSFCRFIVVGEGGMIRLCSRDATRLEQDFLQLNELSVRARRERR